MILLLNRVSTQERQFTSHLTKNGSRRKVFFISFLCVHTDKAENSRVNVVESFSKKNSLSVQVITEA